ncbi:hypothetical protein SAMN06265337_2295 [Hymenobacter gelipurpurascens]|uniref:Uncharacterized protein n=1 Tax=Hymenobacter gelipurpurascens TaxID=89968 RepID=A0A212TQX1_9BACT|nr:hypothetical protein [Hymenobacter gelipurpurascens]SNC68399.1 hypothetical protein SAMN06265337_2295 [Hymenobacter gelipurpurascens]
MDSSTSSSNSQLNDTLQALGGGLSAAAPAAAGNIDSWISTLNGAGSPALSAISSELENLKTAIGSGDGSQISQSLKTLGEHTTKAAESATPDAKSQLQQLGQTLSSAATSLQG